MKSATILANVRLRMLRTSVLTSLLLLALGSMTMRAQTEPSTPEELWLSWSEEAKSTYVWGFLTGFDRGKRAGCEFYEENAPELAKNSPELPVSVCMKALPEPASGDVQEYVDTVTKYFKRYPRDRQAAAWRIVLELASHPNITIDQMHAKLK